MNQGAHTEDSKHKLHEVLFRYFVPDSLLYSGDTQALRRAKVIIYFSWVILAIGPFMVVTEALAGNWGASLLNAVLMNTFLIPPFLYRKTGSLTLNSNILLGLLSIMAVGLTLTSGGFTSPYVIGLIFFPLFAIFLCGMYVGLIWFFVIIIVYISLFMFQPQIAKWPITLELSNPLATKFTGLLVLTSASVALAYLYERSNTEALNQLQSSNEALEEAQVAANSASKAKSSFLANMSHEIRTPLNAILGYSEMLTEDAEDLGFSELTPDLEKINKAGRHLLSLINDILDISKIEAGRMELNLGTFPITELVSSVTASITPQAEKNGNTFSHSIDTELECMYGDQVKLQQSLINILGNACKFTEGGEVKLGIKQLEYEEQPWIRFTIQDTGIGISPGKLKTLFEPFAQGDSSITKKYGGTGLGLAITKKLCTMMGGQIWAKSELGKGSTFVVELPFTAPENLQEREDEEEYSHEISVSQNDLKEASSNSLLLIDDDPNALDLMTRFLTKEGFQVVACSSGREGLKIAHQLHPAAIILDVLMPDMDGWSVLVHLKEDPDLQDIPVIMHTIIDDAKKGYALGASEFMVKPVDLDRLSTILQKYKEEQEHDPMNIMIVEDDQNAREILTRRLTKEGCIVTEADNGYKAMNILDQANPSLILLDLMMPEMDGFAFLQELRKNELHNQVPVIVVTAKELTLEERNSLNNATQAILQKGSYEINELLQEIKDQLPPQLSI